MSQQTAPAMAGQVPTLVLLLIILAIALWYFFSGAADAATATWCAAMWTGGPCPGWAAQASPACCWAPDSSRCWSTSRRSWALSWASSSSGQPCA
jgi:hypothetical protein